MNFHRCALPIVVAVLVALASSPALSAAPVRVLVITGGHDFEPSFWELFAGDDGIVVERAEHPAALAELAPDRVDRFDVVLLYDMFTQETPEDARRHFVSMLAAGKGLVVLHHALANHASWPDYRRIIGGRYVLKEERTPDGVVVPGSTYRHDVTVRVESASPAHPIVRGLDDFDLRDEVYGRTEVASDVHQLLRTSHPDSASVIGWCRNEGPARVVVLQPGHGSEAYRDPSYRRIVRRSIRWVARRLGDSDGLEIGADIRPWTRLFNGRDTSGWSAEGGAGWEVRDGILVGTRDATGATGELLSAGEFGDFELEVTVRAASPSVGSGIRFRRHSVQQAYTAAATGLSDRGGRIGTISRPDGALVARGEDATAERRGGWNTLRVRARGSNIAVDVNGVRVAEALDEHSSRGRVGFVLPAGAERDGARLEVLDARIRPLDTVSADALLLEEASARIERHRRGPLTVRVVDAGGAPVPNARVTLRQTRHDFLFGCNIFMHGRFRDAEDEAAYRDRFAALLNYATLGFYWGAYERRRGEPDHVAREVVARWCRERGIATKGHPLVWNHPASTPRWLPEEAAGVRELSDARTRDCVTRFRGLIDRWDVANEMVDPWRFGDGNRMTSALRELGPVDWTVRSFLLAREANPDALLLINDYRVDPKYEELIESLVHDGKPVYDAIGIQSHMHGGVWSPTRTWDVCDRFARFGVPLHFTEATIVSGPRGEGERWEASTPTGEASQARDAARLYTVLFSHPAVEALTWWDFADRGAWQGAAAGFLRSDLSPKPVYERLHDLIRGRWWTERTLVTDARGEARARATFGSYEVEAGHGELARAARHEHPRRTGSSRVELRLVATPE